MADVPMDKSAQDSSEAGDANNPPVRKRKKEEATMDIRGGVWKQRDDGSSDCLICA